MGNNDTYKLSENPALNYNAWKFRIFISTQLNVLLKTFWDNAPNQQLARSGRPGSQGIMLLLNYWSLYDDQLIHICGLGTEPAKMWERLKTVHEKTGVTGSAIDLWTQFHTVAYTDPSIPLQTHISTNHS